MFNLELVIDIGGGNTTIYQNKKGIVLCEPSVVAVKKQRNKLKLIAKGKEAKRLSRNRSELAPGVNIITPFSEGTVTNSEAARIMLKGFLETVTAGRFFRPNIDALVLISCGTSVVERKNIESIFTSLGIKNVTLVESPIAVAALLENPYNFIVISGATITEVAIVAPTGIITACSVNICGNSMDEAIKKYLSDQYRLVISKTRAEDLRIKLATLSDKQNIAVEVQGRDLIDSATRKIEITAEDLRKAIIGVVNNLADVIESVSMLCPDNLIEDIYHTGITFCGGLANIHGLAQHLTERLKIKVNSISDPAAPVTGGAAYFADRDRLYAMIGMNLEEKK
ncbi:MAG: hypothetical protein EOM87_01380 [Clostridia bacterium]|nr:hypothetical protein [Clostridia bacterium]